jgi:hypothetical protein
VCDEALEDEFKEAKQVVGAALHELAYFQPSPSVATAISSDASPEGLGAMLWQRDGRGQWISIAGASRSPTDTIVKDALIHTPATVIIELNGRMSFVQPNAHNSLRIIRFI